MSTPQSAIFICSGVRLDNRYEHSIYFADETAQREYFAGKVVKTFSAYSYLRKSWPIQVQATMEEARSWSYLFFRNGASGKYYYYFINQIEYKNDNMVELTLEMDVLQTYLFNFTLPDCFVERQHTTTDNPGDWTMDEGLEVGELVDDYVTHWENLKDLCILILATINPNYSDTTKPVDALGSMYDNVFSGLSVWAVPSENWAAWSNKLNDLTEAGFIDGIVSMWMYPKAAVTLGGESAWNDTDLCKVVKGCQYETAYYSFGPPPQTLNGYTPKNKKLLTYPYCFLYTTNNNGGSAVYKYERFHFYENGPKFKIKGSVAPGAGIKIFPVDYNGLYSATYNADGSFYAPGNKENYEQGFILGDFPTCAWDADVYKLWLAQNQNQMQHTLDTTHLAIAGGAVTALASVAMGNVAGAVGGAGAVIGGAQQIGALMAQKADMAIQPPQSKGSFSSNINMSAGYQTFSFYAKCVDAQHARSIDNYFTMYGYKLNRVQKPNLRARKAFTYIKTVGCNIHSYFCTEDRIKIASIFDRGITFWVNGDKIADYTQDNTPL